MKLHMHPVSTTSRPLRLLIAENKLPVEEIVVDLFTGRHLEPPFSELNPNKLVPVLEDGDFVLTESQAILQYLADKFELRDLYPADLQQREVLRADLSSYPNITRWIGKMKALGSWDAVNEAHHGFTAAVKDQEFVGL